MGEQYRKNPKIIDFISVIILITKAIHFFRTHFKLKMINNFIVLASYNHNLKIEKYLFKENLVIWVNNYSKWSLSPGR